MGVRCDGNLRIRELYVDREANDRCRTQDCQRNSLGSNHIPTYERRPNESARSERVQGRVEVIT